MVRDSWSYCTLGAVTLGFDLGDFCSRLCKANVQTMGGALLVTSRINSLFDLVVEESGVCINNISCLLLVFLSCLLVSRFSVSMFGSVKLGGIVPPPQNSNLNLMDLNKYCLQIHRF